jgi:hypothetical protein
MALIWEGTTCAICAEKLGTGDDIFATSGVFFPMGHSLYRYCDAAMHWTCCERWPRRREFAAAYFRACIDSDQANRYWDVVFVVDSVAVSVNLSSGHVLIYLAEAGSHFGVTLTRWNTWLSSPDIAATNLHP